MVKAPCQVFSKATGQKLDTCPTKRKLYAYYEDGDTISLHWPSKNKPTAVITLDDSKISGAITRHIDSNILCRHGYSTNEVVYLLTL